MLSTSLAELHRMQGGARQVTEEREKVGEFEVYFEDKINRT